MTIPWMMNCPHMGDGWCLTCVSAMGQELQDLKLRQSEAVEKDAARYRWMRRAEPWELEMVTKGLTVTETDAAVDQAMNAPEMRLSRSSEKERG